MFLCPGRHRYSLLVVDVCGGHDDSCEGASETEKEERVSKGIFFLDFGLLWRLPQLTVRLAGRQLMPWLIRSGLRGPPLPCYVCWFQGLRREGLGCPIDLDTKPLGIQAL